MHSLPSSQPLHRLRVRDFRNLESLDWRPSVGSHLILGANGAGKTSLLEAVYLAATTRSFRTPKAAELCRHGAPGFHLALAVGEGGRTELEYGWSGGERRRTVNGETRSLVDHLGCLPLVLWTAAEKELLTGGPAVARRVLDRAVVSLRPATLAPLARYRRALQQKRELLHLSNDRLALESYNEVLVDAAWEIQRDRRRYIEQLNLAVEAVRSEVELDLPPLTIEYRASPAAPSLEALRSAWTSAAGRELEQRRPLLGPHRDALRFRWHDRELRQVASAGELKAYGLLLIVAQGRVLEAAGRPPLYLLDDLDTELDPERLAILWSAFGPGSQALATSSRPAVWDLDGVGGVWSMRKGALTPA